MDENAEIMCPNCLPECSETIYTLSSSVKNVFRMNFSIGYVSFNYVFTQCLGKHTLNATSLGMHIVIWGLIVRK